MSDLRGFGIGRMAIATSSAAGWSETLILIGAMRVCFWTGRRSRERSAPLVSQRATERHWDLYDDRAKRWEVGWGPIITDYTMVMWESRFIVTREKLHGEIRVAFTSVTGHGGTWRGFKGRAVVGCIMIISAGQLTDALHWFQIHIEGTRHLLIAW